MEREKVLQRFYRLDTSRSTPGAGLGLMVAAVAELHHAELRLEDNRPGRRVVLSLANAGRDIITVRFLANFMSEPSDRIAGGGVASGSKSASAVISSARSASAFSVTTC